MSIAIDRAPYFGQVEPNHLTAQRNGAIYAQLPADEKIDILENGQFAFYDYAKGKVIVDAADATDADMERFMVLNEVKLYKEFWQESYKDYAMQKKNFTEGSMTPRLFKTAVGDIYTTNCVEAGSYKVGDVLTPDATTGVLKVGTGAMEWTVVAETTMPDAITPGVKLQRTK